MFDAVFYDAVKKRSRQAALDAYRATLEYENVRKDNPTMLERNYVDFSNPESVANMQAPILNPYGLNNPYSNPNLVQQNPGMNPTVYNQPIYGGTWYSWGGQPTAGWGTSTNKVPNKNWMVRPDSKLKVRIVQGEPDYSKIKSPTTGTSRINISKIKARIVVGCKDEEPVQTTNPTPQRPYIVVKAARKPHEPGTPFTKEELFPEYNQLRMIPDTPLNWTARDDDELYKLCESVAVYDSALAENAWCIPTNKECTREDYNYFKRYLNDRLQEYKTLEVMNRHLDYRAKYRYRPLPPVYWVGEEHYADMTKPAPVAVKTVGLGGEVTYDYDRGRDLLTETEWDMFLDRAYVEMMNGAAKLKAQDIYNLNKHLVEPQQTTTQQPKKEDTVNPRDPISVKLHMMKQQEDAYMNHMNFFKHVFRNRLSDDEFDRWWYGTSINPTKQNQDPVEAQKRWAYQMTVNRIAELGSGFAIDPVADQIRINNQMAAAINYFTKGTVRRDMTLQEFFTNLGYLDSRMHEMNIERQHEQARQNMFNQMSHNTFNHTLQHWGQTNPYYSTSYGTYDPRINNNNGVIDLTNNPIAQEKKRQFLQHCQNYKGTYPMSPIYK